MFVSSAKNTGETTPLVFDFLSKLPIGDTIASAVCTCTVWSGVDASPSSVLSGSATISGSKVTQTITGGVAGVTYKITCAATTTAGYVLVLGTHVPVLTDPL